MKFEHPHVVDLPKKSSRQRNVEYQRYQRFLCAFLTNCIGGYIKTNDELVYFQKQWCVKSPSICCASGSSMLRIRFQHVLRIRFQHVLRIRFRCGAVFFKTRKISGFSVFVRCEEFTVCRLAVIHKQEPPWLPVLLKCLVCYKTGYFHWWSSFGKFSCWWMNWVKGMLCTWNLPIQSSSKILKTSFKTIKRASEFIDKCQNRGYQHN